MIHFGLKKLEYNIRFTEAAYYPFNFSEDRKHVRLIAGASFGLWWWRNSIAIAYRPSYTHINKIDLFGDTYLRGYFASEYAGCIDIEKDYRIVIEFKKSETCYKIKAYSKGELKPSLNFVTNYYYPLIPFGYTMTKKYNKKFTLTKI